MDVTTLDRLRAWMDDAQFASQTALANQLIASMSALVEHRLGRFLQSTSRTAYIDVKPGEKVFFLRGYPISATGLAVYEDTSRAFTGSAVSSDDYDTTTRALDEGRIELDYAPSAGPSALKVTYTGGMAATPAALATSYPDLVSACERQIWFDLKHSGMLGLDGHGGGAQSENARREIMLPTWWQAHGDLLPDVVQIFQGYRSFVPRW